MKYTIVTLGCKVNMYESSVMEESLNQHGFIMDDDYPDICIINTCTVTNTASNKSGKMIRHYQHHYPKALIIVCGCYSQIKADSLKDDHIAIIIGNHYKSAIVSLINEYLTNQDPIIKIDDISHIPFENMMITNSDYTRAFVKIEDGCNNFCSYCIIPYSRGGVRSKKYSDVILEVTNLIKSGHHEIVLTGIHTGHYQDGPYHFYDLLAALIKIPGLERLRISSIELNEITDDIINLLATSDILVDHLHIPLQAGSDVILKAMNRQYDLAYYQSRIAKIRQVRPNIAISTDIIVGFPGETDELFKSSLKVIESLAFSKIHVFPYSIRKGTKAALMPNQISDEIKHQRSQELITLSVKLEKEYMAKFIDTDITFIPENNYHDGYLIGHTGNYLLIKAKGPCSLIHHDVKAHITKIDYPYCQAELTNESN